MRRASETDAQARRAETRWPAFVGLIVALVLYLLVPSSATAPLRLAAVVILGLMFIPLVFVNPHRLTRETQWSRVLSMGFSLLLVLANQINVFFAIRLLLEGSGSGLPILLTAAQVWVTNVIAFALLYWELDRGGPVARGNLPREQLPAADFAFPQDDEGDDSPEVKKRPSIAGGWRPGFVDYLYVALTNMMAFSPTDAMPLRSRTKILMALQALTGFVLLALVISRAVNILS